MSMLTSGCNAGGCELHRLIWNVGQNRSSSVYGNIRLASVENEKWEVVRTYLKENPNDVRGWDEEGRTVLMAAVAARAPLDIVEHIFRVSGNFGLELFRDKRGHTALLLALEKGSSLSCVKLLLTVNGAVQLMTSNNQGTIPLHAVLSRFHRSDLMIYGEPDHIEDLVDLFLQVGSPDKQCLAENHIGLTPLHIALESKMPFHIIQKLVQACPRAVSRQGCGYTPLVAAIREDASISTIQYLISVDPRTTKIRDIEGKYPLRRCVDRRNHNKHLLAMLCTTADAVTSMDIFGRTLLQLLLEQWTTSTGLVDPDIVKMFLNIAPDVARDLKWVNMVGGDVCISPLRLCYMPYEEARNSLNHDRERRRVEAVRLSKAWWEIMQDIMRAMREFESPLRAAVTCDAPYDIVLRLLEEDPLCARIPDSVGSYPLHWIFRSHRMEHRPQVVLKILDAAPEIAQLNDADGRLPLHLCVERGGFSPLALTRIIQAYPQALTMLDIRYGLLPFLVAAATATTGAQSSSYTTTTTNGNKNNNDEEETEQLDTIFTLLQAAPEVVSRQFKIVSVRSSSCSKKRHIIPGFFGK